VVAASAERECVQKLFHGLVPAEVIEAYDRLLAQDGCAKDQADTVVGDSGQVAALTGSGMAHIRPHSPADPPWLRPAPPEMALLGVLAGHQYRLARDQELLLDGHRRLADAQAQFGTGMNGAFPAHLVSVVSARAEISELSAALANAARKDWMTLENLHTEMPLTADFAQPPLPAFGGRVRCRSIYAAGAMEHPIARRIIQACSVAGEQARLAGGFTGALHTAGRPARSGFVTRTLRSFSRSGWSPPVALGGCISPADAGEGDHTETHTQSGCDLELRR